MNFNFIDFKCISNPLDKARNFKLSNFRWYFKFSKIEYLFKSLPSENSYHLLFKKGILLWGIFLRNFNLFILILNKIRYMNHTIKIKSSIYLKEI